MRKRMPFAAPKTETPCVEGSATYDDAATFSTT
jgi:hypothetical protein